MAKLVGILTSGGDCPGLNAAIRAIGKACEDAYDIRLLGFLNGFRGLAQDKSIKLDSSMLSGILTIGGTILGTSRDKPHRMQIGGKTRDMTGAILETCERNHLDALVCLGGGGTQRNALRLEKAGLNVITLPKTIDNDIGYTDMSFGFDTAVGIATEAIDRLHSTATSHNRIIVVEVMGHGAGWLALEAGIAGGADAVLIPEIPYDIEVVADSIRRRTQRGKRFSIVVVAEGAVSRKEHIATSALWAERVAAKDPVSIESIEQKLKAYRAEHIGHTIQIAQKLEALTGLESRLTILGHVQRGGTPSAFDRVFATWLGTACARALHENNFGNMLALQNNEIISVPLKTVAGNKKRVPPDHPLIESAKLVGMSFGD
ncbi:MAG: 6-phosphofructokinase [FCB group bacterium]|nr:6-phosphofructokinase [FCB group bacterium]